MIIDLAHVPTSLTTFDLTFNFFFCVVLNNLNQRTFAGVVDPKAEKPVAHIDVDDLHVLSAPEHPDPAKRTEVGACTCTRNNLVSNGFKLASLRQ